MMGDDVVVVDVDVLLTEEAPFQTNKPTSKPLSRFSSLSFRCCLSYSTTNKELVFFWDTFLLARKYFEDTHRYVFGGLQGGVVRKWRRRQTFSPHYSR